MNHPHAEVKCTACQDTGFVGNLRCPFCGTGPGK